MPSAGHVTRFRGRRCRAQQSCAPLRFSLRLPLRLQLHLRPGGATPSRARPRAAAHRQPRARRAARARRDGGRRQPERPPGARARRPPVARPAPAPSAAAAARRGPGDRAGPVRGVPGAVQVGGPPGRRLISRCPRARGQERSGRDLALESTLGSPPSISQGKLSAWWPQREQRVLGAREDAVSWPWPAEPSPCLATCGCH